MKTRLAALLTLLVFICCGERPEIVDGPLTCELLQRHIVEHGPLRYRTEPDYLWTAEEVESIEEQTPTTATIKVRESGYRESKKKINLSPGMERRFNRVARESKLGKKTREMLLTRHMRYGETSRVCTYALSRKSADDFWCVTHCNWTLKLKTGSYVPPSEPEEPLRVAGPSEPVASPEVREPQGKPAAPVTAVEPVPDFGEEDRTVASELGELKKELASLEEELDAKKVPDFPDTVTLVTGDEMECELLKETEDSIRIRTNSGSATILKSRVESFRYATEPEKEHMLQTRLEIDELEKQIADTRLKMEQFEAQHAEALERHKARLGEELLGHAEEGREALVLRALEDGAEPDARDHNGRTPLMLAAFEDHNRIVAELIDAGAEPNARDVDGWTALTYAAYGSKKETVGLLIEWGADVNAKVNSGQSVLSICRQKGYQEIVDLLQRKGAK